MNTAMHDGGWSTVDGEDLGLILHGKPNKIRVRLARVLEDEIQAVAEQMQHVEPVLSACQRFPHAKSQIQFVAADANHESVVVLLTSC
jgi:hypothetical protein